MENWQAKVDLDGIMSWKFLAIINHWPGQAAKLNQLWLAVPRVQFG